MITTYFHYGVLITFTIGMMICGYTDYRTQTLPSFAMLTFYPLLFVDNFVCSNLWVFWSRFGVALLVAILFFFNALFLNGGGGDVLVLPLVILSRGCVIGLMLIGFGCILSAIIHLIRTHIEEHRRISITEGAPLLPGVSILFIISLALEVIL